MVTVEIWEHKANWDSSFTSINLINKLKISYDEYLNYLNMIQSNLLIDDYEIIDERTIRINTKNGHHMVKLTTKQLQKLEEYLN